MADKKPSKTTIVGNENLFKILSKITYEDEGIIKTTKAMEIEKIGCVVSVCTEKRNKDSTLSLISEALTFVPSVKIVNDINGGRKLEWRYTEETL